MTNPDWTNTLDKQHYYLVSGQIIFRDTEGDTSNVAINAVCKNDTATVPLSLMAKAQQGLQVNFYNKVGDASLIVIDVFIIAFSYLGEMTEEEFNKKPEGMTIQEVDLTSA